jgi:hypothetical protein
MSHIQNHNLLSIKDTTTVRNAPPDPSISALQDLHLGEARDALGLAAPKLGFAEVAAQQLLMPQEKINAIAGLLSDADCAAFRARAENSPHDLEALRDILHYRGSHSNEGASNRLLTRATVTLAFARGASMRTISDIRVYLSDIKDVQTSQKLLQRFSRPRVDIDAYVDRRLDDWAFQQKIAQCKGSGIM